MRDRDPKQLNKDELVDVKSLVKDAEPSALPLDEITSVELRDTLPSAYRTFGVGMETYLQGTFSVEGDGSCQLNLDPTQPPFLRVETETGTYWFNAETPDETRAAAQELETRLGL